MTVYRYCVEWQRASCCGNYFVHASDEAQARERFSALFPQASIERVTSMGEVT